MNPEPAEPRSSPRRTLSRRDIVIAMFGAPLASALAFRRHSWPGLAEAWAKSASPEPTTATSTAAAGATSSEALLGAARSENASASALAGRPLPACVARPQQTEGPYFVDERLNRSDIRLDPSNGQVSNGVPMKLRFNVTRIENTDCTPLKGVVVDVWHCDAVGVYSDVLDPSFNTKGKKYLRGYQVTDADGVAEFQTIYPGWYSGRTVHIHFKIRTDPDAPRGYEFTSQLYFDDSISDKVFEKPPYAARGQRNQRNPDDGIYRQGGSQLLVTLTEDGAGYLATFDIGLEGVGALPSATPDREATEAPTATEVALTPVRPTATAVPPTPMPTASPAPTDVAPTLVPTHSPTPAPKNVYLPWSAKRR